MSEHFDEIHVSFSGEESDVNSYEGELLDNGWLKLYVPVEDHGTVEEYHSPCEVENFYVP